MAVIDYDGIVKYKGCVLDLRELNGREESDFCAEVWDEESRQVKDVLYATTRFGRGGSAEIDATIDTLRKAYRYWMTKCREKFDDSYNEEQAKRIQKGDTVVAVKGRILKKGETATVFWVGERYNPYSRSQQRRVGVFYNDERKFLPAENVEVVGWEDRLIRGKKRKEIIRKNARMCMPYHYRKWISQNGGCIYAF